ncbi:MAG: type IVB secretion system protein IcmH/DotU [Pseudomonadota bacterium]
MSDDGNKTVFRPSPLKGGGKGKQPPSPPPADDGWGTPPPPPPPSPPAGGGGWDTPPPPRPPSGGGDPFDPLGTPLPSSPQPLGGGKAFAVNPADMVPNPEVPREDRNPLLAYAGPVLSMVAALQSGRWQVSLQEFHGKASEAIGKFEKAIANIYPEAVRQRATYAVCATVDDVAQNLPGSDKERTSWAQNNMQVMFFRANIGGDRFWNLVKEMLTDPRQNAPLIELYHACLAAGFEGRLRTTADGAGKKQEVMASLFGALEHVRSLSQQEIVTHWRGTDTPRKPINFWTIVALVAACAAGVLLLLYLILFFVLMGASSEPETRVAGLFPSDPVELNRSATVLPPPPSSTQMRLREFLATEIQNGQVEVEKDRVRTTVGTLFASASDQLTGNNAALFRKIGQAIELEPGPVRIEGHADSDRLNPTIEFPNNMALSEARAKTVAQIIGSELSEPGRVNAVGIGDTRPIASNDKSEGKARNRRVEIILDLGS